MISPRNRRPARRAAAALTLAALIPATGLAGCSRGGDDALKGVPAFPVDGSRVTLLNAGRDARVLAFSASEVRDRETRVAVSHGIAQNVAAADAVDTTAPAGGDVGTTTLPLSVSAGKAPAPGKGESDTDRIVTLRAGAPEFSDLAAGKDASGAEGFLMSWRAALSGAVGTVKLLAPEKAPEQGRRAVESALLTVMSTNVVFPTQPVGVDGSWTVENRVTGDAPMVRTATYRIDRIDGDRVTLDVSVEERPTEQSVDIGNSAAGALNGQKLTVEHASTTSEGRIDVDLGDPLPVGGHVDATTRVVYAGPQAAGAVGTANRVVQDITTAVEYGK